MTNKTRSKEFIKMKHSIESCTNYLQLKGVNEILPNISDHNEFLVLLHYLEAKERELNLDDIKST